MKTQLDMDKIARALGAERRDKVSSTGGYFGAKQLSEEQAEELVRPRRRASR